MELDQQYLLSLHHRLLTGDRVATEAVISALLTPLSQEIQRKYPRTDPHQVGEGVTDALLDYCERPATFDATRNVPLDRFLSQAAWCNVRDLLRGEKRRKLREEKVAMFAEELVALPDSAANSEESRAKQTVEQTADLMKTLDNPTDRKILALKLAGERRTVEFAKVLGVEHLAPVDQRRAVKQAKDRIGVQLKRRKQP
jgi:hypothetical protein